MSLRVHLIAERITRPMTRAAMVTACGRSGFKSLRYNGAAAEWEADARLGGLVAVDAATFEPDRHACKRCMQVWGQGGGV